MVTCSRLKNRLVKSDRPRCGERDYLPSESAISASDRLLIAAALRAVKVGGRALWDRYNTGDGLLFRPADLEAPTKSPLFHDLVRSSDSLTAVLADHLLQALRSGLASAPLLEEVLP